MVKFSFETEEVEEGKARIVVPKAERGRGPGKKEGVPFYNPVMEVNRDISVLVVQKISGGRRLRALDGLSGTGIRAIRLGLEVEGELSILLNDWNDQCYELILENMKRNGLEDSEANQEDLNRLLSREVFDYVDVDPFGTPVHFLKNALKGVSEDGVLAITATDTAALVGSYPKACKRKYDAQPLRITEGHEMGLRILIGFCARTAVRHGLGVVPILSHSTDHYFRTYLRVTDDGSQAKKSGKQVGYLSRNLSTHEIRLDREKSKNSQVAGPLWIGKIWDPDFVRSLRPRSYMSSKTSKILELIKSEVGIDSPFRSSDEMASELKVHTPPLAEIVDSLHESGFAASPTHFDPKGFRTDAPIAQIKDIFRRH